MFVYTPPSPLFFVSAHSAGLAGSVSVSADSTGVICTKMVQDFSVLELHIVKELLAGTGRVSLTSAGWPCPTTKKRQSGCRLGVDLYNSDYN